MKTVLNFKHSLAIVCIFASQQVAPHKQWKGGGVNRKTLVLEEYNTEINAYMKFKDKPN